MAYTAFDSSKPDASTQAGTPFGNSARSNLVALRDAIVSGGMVQGFNYSYSGGSADQPTDVLFTRGTERIKLTHTWGTNGTVSKVACYYSSNTGTSYDPMADAAGLFVISFTYDGSLNLTSTTWGTST